MRSYTVLPRSNLALHLPTSCVQCAGVRSAERPQRDHVRPTSFIQLDDFLPDGTTSCKSTLKKTRDTCSGVNSACMPRINIGFRPMSMVQTTKNY